MSNGNDGDSDSELLPIERAALVTMWLVADWQRLTTRDVATRLHMSMDGARYMLLSVSRVIPIYQDGNHGKWQRVKLD